jgi:hypothetical protein
LYILIFKFHVRCILLFARHVLVLCTLCVEGLQMDMCPFCIRLDVYSTYRQVQKLCSSLCNNGKTTDLTIVII